MSRTWCCALFILAALSISGQPGHRCTEAGVLYGQSRISDALDAYIQCRERHWLNREMSPYFKSYWMVLDCLSKQEETRTLLEELRKLKEISPGYCPDSLRANNSHVIKQFEFLFYQKTGDLSKALSVQQSILDSLSALPADADSNNLARIYKSELYLSQVHADLGSYNEALGHGSKAIEIGRSMKDRMVVDGSILVPYFTVVSAYIRTGAYLNALAQLNEILRITPRVRERQSERRISAYLEIGDLFLAEGQLDSASMTIRRLRKENAAGQFNIPISRLQARYLSAAGHEAQAEEVYLRLADSLESSSDSEADLLAEIRTDAALIALKRGDADKALNLFHRAICTMSSVSTVLDPTMNPSIDQLYDNSTVITALNGKAMALSHLSGVPGDNPYAISAWNTIKLAMRYIENLRVGYRTAEDKADLIEKSYQVFQQALAQALRRSDAGLPGSWPDTAFYLMEQSKALNLLEDISHREARVIAGIPDSLIQLESAIIADINQLKKRARDLRGTPGTDGQQIIATLARLDEAQRSRDSLLGAFAVQYPDFVTNTSIVTPDLGDVRKVLKGRELVLEYFAGPERFFMVYFDKRNDGFVEIDSVGTVIEAINTVQEAISATLQDQATQEQTSGMLLALHRLYRLLVEPATTPGGSVVFVPDGVLNSVPFAALLSTSPAQFHDMRTQDYLVRDNSSLYSYSGAIFQKLRQNGSRATYRSSYAFSPAIDTATGFLPLAFGPVEAEDVSFRLGAMLMEGDNCSTTAVKRVLEREAGFGVMHFATHGLANLEHGADSYLQFSGRTDTSRLYAYDLYNRDFDATLVYLSACQTGVGNILAGEGVVSLARAFIRSGAQNLVTSAWSLADAQAKTVTADFYTNLLDGRRVDVAMARAQRELIDNIPVEERFLAHPAYWAGFVVYGNAMPVYRAPLHWTVWFMLFTAAVLLVITFSRKIRADR